MRTKVFIAVVFLGIAGASNTFAAECEDSDGDGWGWDGVATCTVPVLPAIVLPAIAPPTTGSSVNPTSTGGVCIDSDGDGWGWDGENTCTAAVIPVVSPSATVGACIDSDGDGWGWDGVTSCRVAATPSVNPASVAGACIDSDGDGWGWDGASTCAVAVAPAVNAPALNAPVAGACVDSDGDGYGWNGIDSCVVTGPAVPPDITDNITDVVLMMGQSNALGEDTLVDASLDAPDDSVIAWTQFDSWQVANLCTQKWQKAWFPWRGGVCSNHPAFQIAKRIVEKDSSRRVAVIPTGTAGKPIRWWDANGIADNLVNVQVTTALAALGLDKVDLIAWSQGESDHGNEAAWALKLDDLISRLRQRPWFDAATGQFIAQETKWSTVNSKVRELSNDGDPLTKWVPAADQPTKDGVHWSGAALRVISDRYANEYLY